MDITDKLEQTYGVLRSRGGGSHAAYVREGIAEIQLLREDNRALKSELEGLRKNQKFAKQYGAVDPQTVVVSPIERVDETEDVPKEKIYYDKEGKPIPEAWGDVTEPNKKKK